MCLVRLWACQFCKIYPGYCAAPVELDARSAPAPAPEPHCFLTVHYSFGETSHSGYPLGAFSDGHRLVLVVEVEGGVSGDRDIKNWVLAQTGNFSGSVQFVGQAPEPRNGVRPGDVSELWVSRPGNGAIYYVDVPALDKRPDKVVEAFTLTFSLTTTLTHKQTGTRCDVSWGFTLFYTRGRGASSIMELLRRISVLAILALDAHAQDVPLRDLARGLASSATRRDVILRVDPRSAVKSLLSLAENPPRDGGQYDRGDLQIGLAIAFEHFPDSLARHPILAQTHDTRTNVSGYLPPMGRGRKRDFAFVPRYCSVDQDRGGCACPTFDNVCSWRFGL